MSKRDHQGIVQSPAHGDNYLHPRFPRAKSVKNFEEWALALYEAGFKITLSDASFYISEPIIRLDEIEDKFINDSNEHEWFISGHSDRPRRKRSAAQKARRKARKKAGLPPPQVFLPEHMFVGTVTFECPSGASLVEKMWLRQGGGHLARTSRNRVVPFDILPTLLYYWEEVGILRGDESLETLDADHYARVMASREMWEPHPGLLK